MYAAHLFDSVHFINMTTTRITTNSPLWLCLTFSFSMDVLDHLEFIPHMTLQMISSLLTVCHRYAILWSEVQTTLPLRRTIKRFITSKMAL